VPLFFRFLAVILLGGLVVAVGVATFVPTARQVVSASSSDPEEIDLDNLAERSLVFAGNGEVLATLHAEENRSPVALEEVPPEVIDTVLAIEDQEFYEHSGVNMQATIRALFENIESGGIEQGGSTITMQLVKNAILTQEQTADRKTKEIILAYRLENEMSKDEILGDHARPVRGAR
jgi:penicillin-binding protein 1A